MKSLVPEPGQKLHHVLKLLKAISYVGTETSVTVCALLFTPEGPPRQQAAEFTDLGRVICIQAVELIGTTAFSGHTIEASVIPHKRFEKTWSGASAMSHTS